MKGAIVDVEHLAAARHHLVGAFHLPERRAERAARRVGERLTGREHGLLADDARALDFLDMAAAVGDDPVARQQLHGVVCRRS